MELEIRGKRAKGFGAAGFSVFALTYCLYTYTTIRGMVNLAVSSAQGSSLTSAFIAYGIELAFFLGMIYLSIDAIVKYFKNHPTGALPHAIRLIMAFAVYSFTYPIYNKYLRPNAYGEFNLLDLVTTTTGILLIIAIGFAVASLFLLNQSKRVRYVMFAGAIIPMAVLDILTIIWTLSGYLHYWMYDQHLTIFGPWFRLLSYALIALGFFFEKKPSSEVSKEEAKE